MRAFPGTEVKLTYHCLCHRFLSSLALNIGFFSLFTVKSSLSTFNFQKFSLTVERLLRINPEILLEKLPQNQLTLIQLACLGNLSCALVEINMDVPGQN